MMAEVRHCGGIVCASEVKCYCGCLQCLELRLQLADKETQRRLAMTSDRLQAEDWAGL